MSKNGTYADDRADKDNSGSIIIRLLLAWNYPCILLLLLVVLLKLVVLVALVAEAVATTA